MRRGKTRSEAGQAGAALRDGSDSPEIVVQAPDATERESTGPPGNGTGARHAAPRSRAPARTCTSAQ